MHALRFIFILLFLILAVSALSAQGEDRMNTVSLFDDEFIVTEVGIFTKAHWYRNPTSGKEIILIGTNHQGDRYCYEYIKLLLETADFVLHEHPASNAHTESERKKQEEKVAEVRQEILHGNEASLPSAYRTFFMSIYGYFDLLGEYDILDTSQQHWVQGDREYVESVMNNETLKNAVMKKFMDDLAQLDSSLKQKSLRTIREALQKIQSGTFTKRDFGFTMAALWEEPKISEIFLGHIAKPRDEAIIRKLEQTMDGKIAPYRVGIVFGAAHIANLRTLLEERGYEKVRSTLICSLIFDAHNPE